MWESKAYARLTYVCVNSLYSYCTPMRCATHVHVPCYELRTVSLFVAMAAFVCQADELYIRRRIDAFVLVCR